MTNITVCSDNSTSVNPWITTKTTIFSGRLPSELRLQIYGYVWPKGTTRIKILFGVDGTIVRDGSTRQDGGDETALLETCRKVYCERLSVMYDSITFALHSVCRDVEPINGDKTLNYLCPWLEHAQHLELGFWALGIPSPNMGLFCLLGNLIWRFESEKLKRAELVNVGIYGCQLRYGTREFDIDLGWVMGTLVGLKLRGRTVVQVRCGEYVKDVLGQVEGYLGGLGDGGGFCEKTAGMR
ncbi:hypothetical protein LTR27_008574 [Elasticomyces elasticus]|nr:hypothetical protein LTR27_008574 [Elasticomyces elasticus]